MHGLEWGWDAENPVWVKKSSLRFSGIFPEQLGIFRLHFNYRIMRSYPSWITNFYPIICNFDEVMPYQWQAWPPSSHHVRKMSMHHRPKCTLAFSDIFSKHLGIFSLNFTRLLHVPIYAKIQIFVQLSPTMTKLCHIKWNHPTCVSADGGHFEHMMLVVLNMA